MKKTVALIIVLCILMLSACGAHTSEPSTTTARESTASQAQFLAGYAITDITPTESVPLRGSGNTSMRMSAGLIDRLYLTCVALTDENGATALLFSYDISGCYKNVTGPMLEKVSQELSIPLELISLSASHTHNAPDLANGNEPSIIAYRRVVEKQLLATAREALADRKAATMWISSTETKNLTFVRRYILEDGTFAGDNYGHPDKSPIVAYESQPDTTLQLLRFARDGGKDIVLANFQAHPNYVQVGGANHLDVSADFVGVFRESLAQKLDCHVAYFTGACGNLRSYSRIKEDNIAANHREHGNALADYAVAAAEKYQQVQTGSIRVTPLTYTGQVNHSEDHLLTYATEVFTYWQQTNDKEGSTEMGLPYGIESPHHAGAIVAKAKLAETMDLEIRVLAVGDVAFTMSPYEMFDTNGLFIKENSPFAMTMILTCTNDSNTYIPSALGYQNGGYEVHQGRFVAGTGEELADLYVQLLKDLYGN